MKRLFKEVGPFIAPAFILTVTAWAIITYFVNRELEKRFP
jgi:hypothetical protein